MATINVNKLYLAMIVKDELGTGNLIFGTPEYIPGVQQFQAKAKTNTGENYAEGVLTDQDTTLQDVEISFDLRDFTNAQQAKWLGHHVASQGGSYAIDNDVAPWVAILYQYTKAGGGKGWKVYYKGKLTEIDDTVKQMEGKISYQNPSVSATFQPLTNNGMWKYGIEESDDNCPDNIATAFFANVIVPTEATVSALAVSSSVPANGGANVAVSAKPTITFNNAIAEQEINVFNDTDNTAVSATIAFDDAKKVCTIVPAANLAAGKRYEIILAGVKDIYGQELATTIISFTTATA